MKLAIIGLLINFIITVVFYISGQDPNYYEGLDSYNIFSYFAISFWLISVLGLFFVFKKLEKIGAYLIIIGSIYFIPLGLLSVYGALKILRNLQERNLEEARYQSMSATEKNNLDLTKKSETLIFYARKSTFAAMIALGSFILLLLVLEFEFKINTNIAFVIAILVGVIVKHNIPQVTIGDDYIKIGMGARQKDNLLFSEVISFERSDDDKKITIFYQPINKRSTNKLVISLKQMNQEVKDELLKALIPRLRLASK